MADAEPVVLEGLDGGTPLGFLAGIGVQQVLAERARDTKEIEPFLSWRLVDAWRPVLHGPAAFDAVAETVHEDALAWESAPILHFRYVKIEKNGPKLVGALQPPVAVLRHWLRGRRDAMDDASLVYASALMCEAGGVPIGEEKRPTLEQLRKRGIEADPDAPLDRSSGRSFFDFTARNAQFLEQVALIRGYLDADTISAGLSEGRPDARAPRNSLDWDQTVDTPAAIYTGYRRAFLPVALWLAFRGLVCFPVAGEGSKVRTTACTGRRLSGDFVWPLWEMAAGPESVRALVRYPNLARLNRNKRLALGIAVVLRSELSKKADKAGSGMFSPTRAA